MDKFTKFILEGIEENINEAFKFAKQIKGKENKTEILNTEFHLGKYFALVEVLEQIDFDLFMEVYKSNKETVNILMLSVNRLYE